MNDSTGGETLRASVARQGSRRQRRFARLRGKGMREQVTNLTSLPIFTASAALEVGSGAPSDIGQLPSDPLESRETQIRSVTSASISPRHSHSAFRPVALAAPLPFRQAERVT